MHSGEDAANLQENDAQSELAETFFRAASDGDTRAIRNMAEHFRSVSIDETNKNGWTALMLAARNGHADTVQFALENGADPSLINKSGQIAKEIAKFWNQNSVMAIFDKFLKPQFSPRLEFVNHFGTNAVDRQSYKRKDIPYIESLKSLQSTKYVIFADLELLTVINSKGKPGILFLSCEQLNELEIENRDVIYIGKGCLTSDDSTSSELKETAYFAVNFRNTLPEKFPAERFQGQFSGKGYMSHLRRLRAEEAGLAGQAHSVLSWHDRYRHCPTCGSNTDMVESGYKRTCLNSTCRSHTGVHNTCFPRIDPVAIALVISKDGSKCLLGRQARFPPRMYSCLAGFMEPGESIEDAARREVLEESGIEVGRLEYHSSQPWPFPGQLMIGLIGHAITENITVDREELEDAKWFSRAEVAEALAAGFSRSEGLLVPPKDAIAHQLQKAWVQMSSNL